MLTKLGIISEKQIFLPNKITVKFNFFTGKRLIILLIKFLVKKWESIPTILYFWIIS